MIGLRTVIRVASLRPAAPVLVMAANLWVISLGSTAPVLVLDASVDLVIISRLAPVSLCLISTSQCNYQVK